jgi:ATP synthase protein I
MTDEHDRLNRLSSKIEEMRASESAQNAQDNESAREAANVSSGARAGAELVSCIIAGGLIGWVLDHLLESQPLFLIVFLLIGVCSGFYAVYRITNTTEK